MSKGFDSYLESSNIKIITTDDKEHTVTDKFVKLSKLLQRI